MGKINETLTLTDGFSASFRTFIDLGNQAAQTANMLDKNLTHAMGKSAGAIIGNMRQLGSQLQLQNQELIEAITTSSGGKKRRMIPIDLPLNCFLLCVMRSLRLEP